MSQMFYNQINGENDSLIYDTTYGPIEDVEWLENGTFCFNNSLSMLTVKDFNGNCFRLESSDKNVIAYNIEILQRQNFSSAGIVCNRKKIPFKK